MTEVIDDTAVQDVNSRKRTSAVPGMVDNKSKHLELKISSRVSKEKAGKFHAT